MWYLILTTDGWTCSSHRKSYITVTAHYLTDNFQPKSYVLDTCELGKSSTGESIAKVLSEIIKNYDLNNKVR